MNKTAIIKVEGTELKLEYYNEKNNKEEKTFEIITRKQKFTDEQLKKLKGKNPYWADPYWKNGGPCPPGEYYIFYRIRWDPKTGKRLQSRLELCQKRPEKLIVDSKRDFDILDKQSKLTFKESADREHIQIHCGSISTGCIVIDDCKKLYKIVLGLFRRGILVKIIIDDYWKTKEGKDEINRYNSYKSKNRKAQKERRVTKRCGAKCKYFDEYGYCDRLVYDPPCWQHRT